MTVPRIVLPDSRPHRWTAIRSTAANSVDRDPVLIATRRPTTSKTQEDRESTPPNPSRLP